MKFIFVFTSLVLLAALPTRADMRDLPPGPPPDWAAGPSPQNKSATEATGACLQCELSSNTQMDLMKSRIAELEAALKTQKQKQSEEDLQAAEHQKERMLKKIDNMDCPQPKTTEPLFGDSDDEDGGMDSLKEMMSMAGGGPRGKGPSADRRESAPQMSLVMREEIEDAIEDKMKKCKKKAQRQQSQRGGNALAMQGMQANRGGQSQNMDMSSMMNMMAMVSMGGMGSSMGTSMGMGSMGGRNMMGIGGVSSSMYGTGVMPWMQNTRSTVWPAYYQTWPVNGSATNGLRSSGFGI